MFYMFYLMYLLCVFLYRAPAEIPKYKNKRQYVLCVKWGETKNTNKTNKTYELLIHINSPALMDITGNTPKDNPG